MPCLKHGHRHFRWLLAPSRITCCHILDAVQGKGSILRCYLHGRSIGYFISQKLESEAVWGGTAGGMVLGMWDSRATVTIRVSL